jgi:hypothetical protein
VRIAQHTGNWWQPEPGKLQDRIGRDCFSHRTPPPPTTADPVPLTLSLPALRSRCGREEVDNSSANVKQLCQQDDQYTMEVCTTWIQLAMCAQENNVQASRDLQLGINLTTASIGGSKRSPNCRHFGVELSRHRTQRPYVDTSPLQLLMRVPLRGARIDNSRGTVSTNGICVHRDDKSNPKCRQLRLLFGPPSQTQGQSQPSTWKMGNNSLLGSGPSSGQGADKKPSNL